MQHDLTHASFFSGVGGLDLGLERAGWRTVSFSEIDPYASAVLAERWPGVPNLGDIVAIAEDASWQRAGDLLQSDWRSESSPAGIRAEQQPAWRSATLWSGGFPCQDLSVAGKRAGFAGSRSGLAFAFLDLVEQHRPPAILLENVPGLLSSHGGKDFGALLARLVELGYGWAYRILDAQHFGVPQRRRRVFIVAFHAESGLGADSAAAVLSVGARCERHPATGHPKGEGAAERIGVGIDIARAVTGTSGKRHDDDTDTLLPISPPPDPGGVRAPDGLAGWVDDLAPTLRVGPARPQDGGPGDTVPIISTIQRHYGKGIDVEGASGGHLVTGFRKSARVNADPDSPESWVYDGLANTLNSFDVGDVRTTHAVVGLRRQRGDGEGMGGGRAMTDDLPLGLDSHRYRCCGNGVVSSVAEWVGLRLAVASA